MGRRLGQHFLTDPAILDRIVDAILPDRRDAVLEIGAGIGTLTRRLAPRVGRVIAIEKDRVLVDRLRAQGPDSEPLPNNVRVVADDALRCDWWALVTNADLTGPPPKPGPVKIAGNIPYAITTPLLEKALLPPLPSSIVFLVQKDVAERIAADPGSKRYGALSVGIQVVAAVERLFSVRAGSFSPPPKVESAVIRLTPLAKPMLSQAERPEFRRFVTALFGQRRKQLRRSLRTVLSAEKSDVARLLVGTGLDPASRPEVLTPLEFVRLFRERGSLTRQADPA